MRRSLLSMLTLSILVFAAASCGDDEEAETTPTAGAGGKTTGGSGGASTGGSATTGGSGGSTGGSTATGGSAGASTAGSAGTAGSALGGSGGKPAGGVSKECENCFQDQCKQKFETCINNANCKPCIDSDSTDCATNNNLFKELCDCGVSASGPCSTQCAGYCG